MNNEEEKAMNSKMISILLVLMSASAALAESPFQAGAHFSLGFPRNEFAETVDATGFGGGGSFLYHIPYTGLSFGAGIDFFIYGSETRSVPFSSYAPEVTVDVTRTNSIFQGFLMMRLQPDFKKITPYADGLFGFNYLSTSTDVESQDYNDDDDDIASSTNYDDGALCYGGGAGLLIKVYESQESEDFSSRDLSVFVDAGCRMLVGGEAEYLKKGDIEIDENNKVIYHPNRSETDLFVFNIGVSFLF
jgi:hypothetical protein